MQYNNLADYFRQELSAVSQMKKVRKQAEKQAIRINTLQPGAFADLDWNKAKDELRAIAWM